MTNFHERLRALSWGRELLEELAAAKEPTLGRALAAQLLSNYPPVAEIDARLEACGSYALLLAVRSFDRTAGLLDRFRLEADSAVRHRAMRIARHFPERQDLVLAVRSPHAARAWAAMYLDRSPGRAGLLRDAPPTRSPSSPDKRLRRKALRQLVTALRGLQLDHKLTPFALWQVQQTLMALPSRRLLAGRFAGEDLQSVNRHLRAVQQACEIVDAVADGTFPTSRRVRAGVLRLQRRLPASDWFALDGISEEHRQAWVDELFLRRPRRRRRSVS